MKQSEIIAEIQQLKQRPQLDRRERRYLAKLEKKLHPTTPSSFNLKGILAKLFLVLTVFVIIGGIAWYVSTRPNLPPIDMEGHVEQNPKSHVLNEPMPEPIQKHMLEHADGQGPPGILIQYNCQKFICDEDLIDKLKNIVKQYPENVYLSPGNYDGKIILTKLGKREILDSYNEEKIKTFSQN